MKITFTSTRRIVGNPSTFLFGPRKGQLMDGCDFEVLAAYGQELRTKRRDIPPRLLHVHTNMLEIAGCTAVGEPPAPYLVGGLEEDDFNGGWDIPRGFPF